ncbi:type IX secretion/gliding motility protein PorT/SprT [Tellurirhabdus rosea]|uniref:type IX secretion/gliding motility protein PorT/SprT n=1 Tax=Tellurirhabdus rosea TaxID=2674997 RepID=UPI00225A4887|nr:porin family protein [Tellurirhabdus rosea]
MLYLHRKKIALTALLLALWAGETVQAQSTVRYRRVHQEGYDDKVVHYGFLFALPVTRFNVKYSDAYVTQDSAYQLYSPSKAGFRVGFVMNAAMTEHWDVRMTPAISLYGRTLEYKYANAPTRKETRESAWLELPILLKYKSQRRHNTRMYALAGISLGIETNVRRREVTGSSRLLTKNTDVAVEYGVGLEQFFEFFKFAPELRFSHGLVNLFEQPNVNVNQYNQSVRRLNTHTVSLYLNFE